MSGSQPLSFKIQAPVRTSSPLAQSSSSIPARPAAARRPQAWQAEDSDSDEEAHHKRKGKDELVTGIDERGFEKKHAEKKQSPLVIASLPNKDWREAAKEMKAGKRSKKQLYIPDSVTGAMSMTAGGSSKSQGGAGTTDRINDSVVIGGLEFARKETVTVAEDGDAMVIEQAEQVEVVAAPPPPVETEDQRIVRELIAGGELTEQPKELEAIISASDNRGGPLDEADAFKRDLLARPDESTLEDYARVPVGQFGAAMLRGMGWKEGTVASRSGRGGPVEAFVPKSRPALLGIGAKPIADVLGEEKGKNGKPVRKDRREDMKFMPLVRREKEGETSASDSSRPSSRRPSRSPPPRIRDRERDSDRDRHRSSKRPRSRSRSPERLRGEYKERSRDERDRRDRDRDYRDQDRDRDRESRRDRDRDGYRARDKDRDRDRDDRDRRR